MRLRPVLFILILIVLSCKQKENFVMKSDYKRKAIDRLNERYFLIRTLLTFPKLGIDVPANSYVISPDQPDDTTFTPYILIPHFGPHPTTDDLLSVPYGTLCNFSLKKTRLFFNAGSFIAFQDDSHGTDFTGELNIQTGQDEVFNITTTGWQVKVEQNSRANIMAYADEQSITITLGEGSVLVRDDSDINVLNNANEAIIIDKAEECMTKTPYSYDVAAAWTNGRICGIRMNLPVLCRQLERIYRIPFGPVKYDSVYGNYNIPYRDLTLGKVLELLQQARGIYPNFQGDSIYMVKKE